MFTLASATFIHSGIGFSWKYRAINVLTNSGKRSSMILSRMSFINRNCGRKCKKKKSNFMSLQKLKSNFSHLPDMQHYEL